MDQKEYTIQELSEASGVARRNVYFYTQQGILPAPAGAGLAARYGEIHLLRLQAIPILRGQGLRLDEIRQRLQAETLESLRQLVNQPVVKEDRAAYIYPAMPAAEPRLTLAGRAMKQFDFPGGVTITAPAVMTIAESKQLARLLKAARDIYFDPQLPQNGGKE